MTYQHQAIPSLPPTFSGNLPKTWHVTRMKQWVSINQKTLPEDSDPNQRFDYIEIGAVTNGSLIDQPKAVTFGNAPSRARRVVQPGDTIISMVRTYLKAVWFAEQATNLVCSTGFAVLTPKSGTIPKFVSYLVQSEPFIQHLNANSVGTSYPAVSESKFADIKVPVPPLDEQATIVRYLDHADELIKRYISTKERLIALLEEQRDAAVQRAVTRGLNPNAPLEPSGTSWIGDIPAHWTVRRLRTLVDISTGGKDTVDAIDDGQFPFFVRSQTVERINTWSFDGEAVLTAGDGVGVGKVFHYINGKFDYHQRVYKFSQFDGISGRLFYHYLRAMLPFMTSQGTAKSTVDSLRLPMLQNFPVVVPPSREQEFLIHELDQIDNRTEEAIQVAKTQIDLINEYRTRLIADAVTGQLDVRDAAAELPTGHL